MAATAPDRASTATLSIRLERVECAACADCVDGDTAIDASAVTGESLPLEKDPGDAVIAGTVNQSGSARFRATKVGAGTALAQIVAMVGDGVVRTADTTSQA